MVSGRLTDEFAAESLSHLTQLYYAETLATSLCATSDTYSWGFPNMSPKPHLLTLPAEVRMMIWKYLLFSRGDSTGCWWSHKGDNLNNKVTGQVLWTCRKMFDEGLPLLYGGNVFDLSFLQKSLTKFGLESASMISKLELDFFRWPPREPEDYPFGPPEGTDIILVTQELEDFSMYCKRLRGLQPSALCLSARFPLLDDVPSRYLERLGRERTYWAAWDSYSDKDLPSKGHESAMQKLAVLHAQAAASAVKVAAVTAKATLEIHCPKLQYLFLCNGPLFNLELAGPRPWLILSTDRLAMNSWPYSSKEELVRS